MRKAKPQKRVILPDPVYGEVMVAKFVNHLMLDGTGYKADAVTGTVFFRLQPLFCHVARFLGNIG